MGCNPSTFENFMKEHVCCAMMGNYRNAMRHHLRLRLVLCPCLAAPCTPRPVTEFISSLLSFSVPPLNLPTPIPRPLTRL